jgi:hypothetical protein
LPVFFDKDNKLLKMVISPMLRDPQGYQCWRISGDFGSSIENCPNATVNCDSLKPGERCPVGYRVVF